MQFSYALEPYEATPLTGQVTASSDFPNKKIVELYALGNITLGDILEILPFEDPLVVLELDGESVWVALEAGLETWPAQEG
jgi:2',3'-cyclic-nucleotide 2'-phosphodiesterase (5'-nucleotidase family)